MTGRQRANYLARWFIAASAPVAAAAMIGVGGVLWSMYNHIQRMDAGQQLWQERMTHQLDIIADQIDGTYDRRDGLRMESKIERHGVRLEDHEDRIRALERGEPSQ